MSSASENGSMLPASDEAQRTQSYSANDQRAFRDLRKAGLRETQWFETAIDPFHDLALETKGYPDYDSTASITQVVKKVRTIAAPMGLVEGDTWDLNLFSTGQEYTSKDAYVCDVAGLDFHFDSTQGQMPREIGMLTWLAAKTGANDGVLYPTTATRDTWIANQTNLPYDIANGALSPVDLQDTGNGLSLPNEPFLNGPHRVIAWGYELVNTTAPLYVQGALIPWRQNRSISNGTGQYYADEPIVAVTRPIKVERFKGPPTTVEEAMLLPDSRMWHAKHGAYVVATQMGQDNPLLQNEAKIQLLSTRDCAPGEQDTFQTTATPSVNASMSLTDLTLSGFGDSANRTFGCRVTNSWNSNGVWATGLSPQTRFQLNLRVVIERAPTLSEKTLVVLARPSPPADELAWRLYSECVRRMPPGVQLKENWTGEWFNKAITNVARATRRAMPLMKVAAPLLGPEAVIAAEIADLATSKSGRVYTKKEQKMLRRSVAEQQLIKKDAKALKRRKAKLRKKKLQRELAREMRG